MIMDGIPEKWKALAILITPSPFSNLPKPVLQALNTAKFALLFDTYISEEVKSPSLKMSLLYIGLLLSISACIAKCKIE